MAKPTIFSLQNQNFISLNVLNWGNRQGSLCCCCKIRHGHFSRLARCWSRQSSPQLVPQLSNSRNVKGSSATHQRMRCPVSTSGWLGGLICSGQEKMNQMLLENCLLWGTPHKSAQIRALFFHNIPQEQQFFSTVSNRTGQKKCQINFFLHFFCLFFALFHQ